mmetsp:Transcript_43751/g.135125  ORF Transcript_43751/g.135125 Transcript_43751/m.135125 type:complete len:339 (+) Transcript_43751:1797-2813(+)
MAVAPRGFACSFSLKARGVVGATTGVRRCIHRVAANCCAENCSRKLAAAGGTTTRVPANRRLCPGATRTTRWIPNIRSRSSTAARAYAVGSSVTTANATPLLFFTSWSSVPSSTRCPSRASAACVASAAVHAAPSSGADASQIAVVFGECSAVSACSDTIDATDSYSAGQCVASRGRAIVISDSTPKHGWLFGTTTPPSFSPSRRTMTAPPPPRAATNVVTTSAYADGAASGWPSASHRHGATASAACRNASLVPPTKYRASPVVRRATAIPRDSGCSPSTAVPSSASGASRSSAPSDFSARNGRSFAGHRRSPASSWCCIGHTRGHRAAGPSAAAAH